MILNIKTILTLDKMFESSQKLINGPQNLVEDVKAQHNTKIVGSFP